MNLSTLVQNYYRKCWIFHQISITTNFEFIKIIKVVLAGAKISNSLRCLANIHRPSDTELWSIFLLRHLGFYVMCEEENAFQHAWQ